MNKISEIIKSQLEGWKSQELAILILILVFIIVNAFYVKDSIVAIISAIFGILYTAFAGKGKIACFFFGLIGSGCYAYISFKNAVCGIFLLYLCYYIPLEIIGIFQWKKNLKKDKNEIIKTKLSFQERLKLGILTFLITLITIYGIYYFKGSSPIIDGITTIFSIAGMYLTVKRCIEQWFLWIIVNGLCALMWMHLVFFQNAQAISTIIMWCVYFVMAIYFFQEWKKEVKI